MKFINFVFFIGIISLIVMLSVFSKGKMSLWIYEAWTEINGQTEQVARRFRRTMYA